MSKHALAFTTVSASELGQDLHRQLFAEFSRCYRQANLEYLESSLERLSTLALAMHGETLVGFALGDAVKTQLPEMAQDVVVALAGISCVAPEFRRQGLFAQLEHRACYANGLLDNASQMLLCGRMAHPVSLRILSKIPNAVPKPNDTLTSWQLAVGQHIAGLYGVMLKPNSLIVKGKGRPIGYPDIASDPQAPENALFAEVDRSRGEALLAMAWLPDAPARWMVR